MNNPFDQRAKPPISIQEQAMRDAARFGPIDSFPPPPPRRIPSVSTATSVAKKIMDFQQALAQDESIILGLIGVDDFTIQNVRAEGEDLLIFSGTTGLGKVAILIQNVAQTNILVQAVPKMADEEPRRIGFNLE